MNEVETRLRSWLPRRPSAKFERRLFALTPESAPLGVETDCADTHHFRLAWLAPATLALLVVGLMFNQRSLTAFAPGGDARAWVAVALSNQNAAAWMPGTYGHDQNTVPAETFEGTNLGRRTN